MSASANQVITQELLDQLPDNTGHFGPYGGRFVSETLMSSLLELEEKYRELKKEDPRLEILGNNLSRTVRDAKEKIKKHKAGGRGK